MGLLDTISQATKLEKKQLVKYSFTALVLFVVFGIGQALVTTLLGVAYPVFMSFHALENNDKEPKTEQSKNDDKQWLTYWVVFGLFNMVDQFAGFILHFIPFYYVLKLAVLIWLFHPKTVGATWVYTNYIQEYVEDIKQFESSAKGIAGFAKQSTNKVE